LAGWRAATSAPRDANVSAIRLKKTVSNSSSWPSDSGTIAHTQMTVTARRIQGSRAVLDGASRDTVTPALIAAIVSHPAGVAFDLSSATGSPMGVRGSLRALDYFPRINA